MQHIIKKQQLSYFSSNNPTQVCFYNLLNQLKISLIDNNKVISFSLPQETISKGQDLQPQSTFIFNTEYPLLQAFSIKNNLFFLQANHKLIIQSNAKAQIFQQIWGALPLNCQKPVVMLLQWNKDQQLCQLKFINLQYEQKKIVSTSFPVPKHIHLFTQNWIITDQYLINIKIPTNWAVQQHQLEKVVKMLPNPAYDGILDKVFLGINQNYIVYQIEDATYFERYSPSNLKHVVPLNSKPGVKTSKGLIFTPLNLYIVVESYHNKQNCKINQLTIYSLQHGIKILSFPIDGKHFFLLYGIDKITVGILNIQTLQISWINVLELIKPHQFQERINNLMSEKYHINIIKTLEFREKHLLGMKRYAQKGDYQSSLRMIANQQNISIVVDGIKMIYNSVKTNLTQQLANSIAHICKQIIQKSKYESHLQQALIILLQLVSIASKNTLANIAQTKRIQKLIKQDKKLKLFQLSFQFIQKVKPII